MSDHIPLEIQEQILKKLPVKSVVRFLSVSKEWKSLINSSKFIKDHHTQSQLHYHLLVDTGKKYISVTDNNNFHNHQFPVTVPNDLRSTSIVGSSHGILCFRGCYRDSGKTTEQVVLWNPTVKKSVRIYIPHRLYHRQSIVVGFGVCPETNDPKLVKICVAKPPICWEVEVFALSSRLWRSVSNFRESRKLRRNDKQVSVDGFIYFHSIEYLYNLGVWSNFIVSFDLKREEFREVCLPDKLVHSRNMRVSKVKESFSVLEYIHDGYRQVCDVWAMKDDGVSEYFTKIFTVKLPSNSVRSEVLGFRKNGEVLINMVDNIDGTSRLKVYKPSSGRIKGIGINGAHCELVMKSYIETLFLLDQEISIIS